MPIVVWGSVVVGVGVVVIGAVVVDSIGVVVLNIIGVVVLNIAEVVEGSTVDVATACTDSDSCFELCRGWRTTSKIVRCGCWVRTGMSL